MMHSQGARGVALRAGVRPPGTAAPLPRSAGAVPGRRAAAAAPPPRLRTVAGAALNELAAGIARFYDDSTPVWEEVWGEHLHHGYYPDGKARSDHQQAQVDMVEESLRWAGVKAAKSVVDVGCGIGGSSRHLARKFNATAQGVTLSPVQVERARALTAKAGLADRVGFQVADALAMPFEDNTFDLVWSMESGEHMPDKKKFMSEMARVAAPGGTVLLVTWCHRPLAPGEQLRPEEKDLLDRICAAYYLPAWCSIDDYAAIAKDLGLEGIRTADWSREVQPFWRAVIDTALTPRGFVGLLKSGWTTIKGALVMPLMQQGLRTNTIKFNLLVATKSARRK